jgi:hypothetical protein
MTLLDRVEEITSKQGKRLMLETDVLIPKSELLHWVYCCFDPNYRIDVELVLQNSNQPYLQPYALVSKEGSFKMEVEDYDSHMESDTSKIELYMVGEECEKYFSMIFYRANYYLEHSLPLVVEQNYFLNKISKRYRRKNRHYGKRNPCFEKKF